METIGEPLYQKLRQDIVECVLTPGKSFSEAELGRLYKASRSPVREACRRLEAEGLVRITPFRGYAIAPLSVSEFHDLQEMQLIFEPAAAALAAERANAQLAGERLISTVQLIKALGGGWNDGGLALAGMMPKTF